MPYYKRVVAYKYIACQLMGYFECNNIEDLIFNRSFRDWVLSDRSDQSDFWENWIAANQDKSKLVNDSKAIIYALQLNFNRLSEEEINLEIKKILQRVKDQSLAVEENEYPAHTSIWRRPRRLMIIASIMVVSISTLLFFIYSSRKTNAPGNYTFSNVNTGTGDDNNNFEEQVNTSGTTQQMILPDGSEIWLEPKSSIKYARNFSGDSREVHLSGEAFFKVKKNAARPFLVFTTNIITKVLGTSFRVKAYETDKKAIVTVKTGKVSVFRTDDSAEKNATGAELKGIVLTPNQEVVYNTDNNGFNKALTAKPAVVTMPSPDAFSFDATPVSRVFTVMEEAYSIPVIYDEETLSSCSLSASLGNESFYEKLNIICKAINASYEVIDGNIIITSAGCR